MADSSPAVCITCGGFGRLPLSRAEQARTSWPWTIKKFCSCAAGELARQAMRSTVGLDEAVLLRGAS